MKDFLERIGFNRKTNVTIESTTPELTARSIQRRMIVFGALVIFSMVLIILRLFYIQIIANESYIQKLENYTRSHETITTPRGEIYDRNGEKIVTNKIIKSIIYYPPKFHGLEERWEMAQKFASEFNTEELVANKSDLNDAFYFLNTDDVKARATEEEVLAYRNKEYTNAEYERLLKNKITEDDHASMSSEIIQSYKVYQQMIKPTANGMKIIVSNAENNEIAYLAEHNSEYPGFESFSNWDRDYLDSFGLGGVIGTISTETQGLSSELVDFYLAKDYSRDERMGRSGLEAYYEDIISGDKIIQDVVYTDDGYASPQEIQSGAKGDDLIMAIDLDLQKKSEEVVTKYMEQEKGVPFREYYDSTYVIVSDPRNGDILASVNLNRDGEGGYYNNAAGNHLDTVIPGSTIKGAMVYLGLSENVVTPTEQISDAPIKIASTPLKRSYQNLVSTNAVTALAQSSNVYMFHVAMRIANASYAYDQPLYGVDESDFMIMKNNFSKFGLGTKTGLDVPNEALGYTGQNFLGGFILDYAMGQYDTYTPMQLATYVNTIANDGVRVKPRYVKGAKDPMSGMEVYTNEVEVVSTLDDLDALKQVQLGFRTCVTDGLCRGSLNDKNFTVAAKTGTAEASFKNDDGVVIDSTVHSLLVGYAPFENPEVSITCVTPNSTDVAKTRNLSNICQPIAGEILDYYFNNK